ncbi:MAG: hypothetical protein OXE99_12270 [Cellvibrionales bacterium]|nr:hypothetical protein [Cellvibrionales bacterium]
MKSTQILALSLTLAIPTLALAETTVKPTTTPAVTDTSASKKTKEAKGLTKNNKKRKLSKKRKYRMENRGKDRLSKAEMLEKKRSQMTNEERAVFDKKMAERKAKKEAFKKMSPDQKKAFIADKRAKHKAKKQENKGSGMLKKAKKVRNTMKMNTGKKRSRS